MMHRHPFHALVAAIALVPVVGYPVWCMFDRAPPYVRNSGEIRPGPPEMCGLQPDDPTSGITGPGSCVTVEWDIRVVRNCRPDRPGNLIRRIRDSEGVVHTITDLTSLYGRSEKPPTALTRYFLLPSGVQTGPATYSSSATFACNPLQEYGPSFLFPPIAVDRPDIKFTVEGTPLVRPPTPAQRLNYRSRGSSG
jgi:hypothetical protein